MTNEKSFRYKRAYTELVEILNHISKEQREKISDDFISNISNNMDKNYKFIFDESKGIFEQDLMIETEALLLEIYERYLAPDEEKEIWRKYDKFCLNKIEENKKLKFSNDIFNNEDSNNSNDFEKDDNNLPVKYDNKNFFKKICDYLKNIFKR